MRQVHLVLVVAFAGCASAESQRAEGIGGSVGGDNSAGTNDSTGSVAAAGSGSGGGTNAAGANSGGSPGTSGSGGSGGGPQVVRPCNQLPKPGVWEDITPAPSKGKWGNAGAFLVNPKDPATVYAGTSSMDGLFKSTDCGANWVHINTGTNGKLLESGRLWDMVIDPVDPEIMYAISGYGAGGLWKSTDGGVDWENTTPATSEVGRTANANFTSVVGMDVTDHLHLVITFHSGCSGAYAPNCQAETKDGGATWRLLKSNGGGEGVGVIVLNATTWLYGLYNDVEETTDSGASWFKVASATAHWQVYHSASGDYIGTLSGVLKSTDTKAWTPIPGFTQQAEGITGDGTNVYVGQQWGRHYFKVPESNPSKFTELPMTDGNDTGGYFLAFDPDHHILYSSESSDGYWRMVVP
jgi:hypothetical protein